MVTKVSKYRMGEVTVGEHVYTCSLGKLWPPLEIVYYGTLEEAAPYVKNTTYQRLNVWAQVCGLKTMQEDKCPTCPHVLCDGKPKKKSPALSGLLLRIPPRR